MKKYFRFTLVSFLTIGFHRRSEPNRQRPRRVVWTDAADHACATAHAAADADVTRG